MRVQLTQTQLILLTGLFLTLFYNFTFFSESYKQFHNIAFLIAQGILLFIVITTLLLIISNRFIIKPLLIIIFLLSSLAAYYMNQYKVIIDYKMIQNIFETDKREVHDLINLKVIFCFILLGILPSILLMFIKIKKRPIKSEIISRIKILAIFLILIPILYFSFSKYWVSFFRTHKHLRMYTNPTFYIYSFFKYLDKIYFTKPIRFKHIGLDAHLQNKGKPKLIIFVLGEAAREDHFSLNGYKRDTNPQLSQTQNITSFTNMYSCATATATSVPCMFSIYTKDQYNDTLAKNTDNVIDILNRAGVNVIWLDNDSGSKGVANRIKNYIDFSGAKNPKYCQKSGCIDQILLDNLPKYFNKIKNNNPVFIVLHTKGSHGPAYYKRYPKEFEKFKPVCKTNQLQKCKKEEVVNAYDNTILYTDYFLKQTINFLKKHQNKYQVAMIYVADHGESLGENGIYLHGLPYFIAPDAQKHPATITWFSKEFDINQTCVNNLKAKTFSHDNLFSTILGLMDVKTKVYNPKLDMFYKCKK